MDCISVMRAQARNRYRKINLRSELSPKDPEEGLELCAHDQMLDISGNEITQGEFARNTAMCKNLLK